MKTICFNVDKTLYSKIQEYCRQTGYTEEFLIREAVCKHLNLIKDLLVAKKILSEEDS